MNNQAFSWPADALIGARKRTDELSDNFIAQLTKEKSKEELYGILQYLLNEYTFVNHEKLDPDMLAYYQEASKLPDWVNYDQINIASKFFAVHGIEITMMLLMKSLPATYACGKGAEVVYSTGRMNSHGGNEKAFTRRLMQTAKFVLNVLSEDALKPNGIGVKACAKVRALHAFIRLYLQSMNWDEAKYDKPINQEDEAGTILSFSVFVIEGMESLGVKVTQQEKDAYHHAWSVIAYLMGVEHTLIADSYEKAQKLGHYIIGNQKSKSVAGERLAAACVHFLQDLIPYRILKFTPSHMIYFLIGPELSDMLNIKRSGNFFVRFAFFMVKKIIRLYEWSKRHFAFVERWAIKNNPLLMDAMARQFLKASKDTESAKETAKEVSVVKENIKQ